MIGPTLRAMRESRGLSIRATAARAGLSTGGLWKIEHDMLTPTTTTIVRIADALNCDAALTITPRDHAT